MMFLLISLLLLFCFLFFSVSSEYAHLWTRETMCAYFHIKIYKYVGDDFHKGQVNDVPSQKHTTTAVPNILVCICRTFTFTLHVCMLLGKSYESVIFFFVHFQPSLNFDFGIVTDLSACECRFTQSILISFYMCI